MRYTKMAPKFVTRHILERQHAECILTVLVRKEIGLILINCVKYAKGIAPITADVNSLSL